MVWMDAFKRGVFYGQLSTLLEFRFQQPNRKDLKLPASEAHLPVPLILDGHVMKDNLKESGLDRKWLERELSARGHTDASYVFADWRPEEGIHISPR